MSDERSARGGAAFSARSVRGQSTVEYALVLLGILGMVVALVAVWRAGQRGALLDRAVEASSHQLEGLGGLRDIALY